MKPINRFPDDSWYLAKHRDTKKEILVWVLYGQTPKPSFRTPQVVVLFEEDRVRSVSVGEMLLLYGIVKRLKEVKIMMTYKEMD